MALFSFGRRGNATNDTPYAPNPEGIGCLPWTDEPTGPGWYDSSSDLRRGLIVREGPPADIRLHEWMEQHLQLEACAA